MSKFERLTVNLQIEDVGLSWRVWTVEIIIKIELSACDSRHDVLLQNLTQIRSKMESAIFIALLPSNWEFCDWFAPKEGSTSHSRDDRSAWGENGWFQTTFRSLHCCCCWLFVAVACWCCRRCRCCSAWCSLLAVVEVVTMEAMHTTPRHDCWWESSWLKVGMKRNTQRLRLLCGFKCAYLVKLCCSLFAHGRHEQPPSHSQASKRVAWMEHQFSWSHNNPLLVTAYTLWREKNHSNSNLSKPSAPSYSFSGWHKTASSTVQSSAWCFGVQRLSSQPWIRLLWQRTTWQWSVGLLQIGNIL